MYRYYKEENVIKEVASMEQPAPPDLPLSSNEGLRFYVALEDYEQHIKSLKSFPCHESCVELWNDGKEVSEGVDFEIKNYRTAVDEYLQIAYPLTKPETEDEDEDELWLEAEKRLWEDTSLDTWDANEATEELKKHYSIKRIAL